MNFIIRALAICGLATGAFLSTGMDTSVSELDASEAQAVRAGAVAAFSRDCFQNVSDCIVCTNGNNSCTLTGRIDACRLTPPATLCAILVNPPTCGNKINWSMPNCGGIGAISITQKCFEFICT